MTTSVGTRPRMSGTARLPDLAAAVLWLVAPLVYLGAEAVAASRFAGYSYATNYISDLGVPDVGSFQGREIDSPLHAVMNAGFIAHGLLFVVAAVLASRAVAGGVGVRPRRAFVSLAAVHAVGIILVGLVAGSQANVDSGIAVVHVAGAAMAIVAGNLAVIVGGVASARLGAPRAYRFGSVVIGVAGLVGLVLLVGAGGTAGDIVVPDGVWERVSVYSVMLWQLVTATILVVARAGRRHRRADAAAPSSGAA